MRMAQISRRTLVLFLLCSAPFVMSGSVIVNGSFEANGGGICDSPMFTTLPAANNCLTGWTIGGGGIDYIHNYWQPADGTHSLDLNAVSPGFVQQTFATIAGQGYVISFALAGNPDGAPTVKTVAVDVGGPATTYSFNVTGHTTASMGWITDTFAFIASGASTTLTFTSTIPGAFGPALDNVTIADAAVPEPASAGLLLVGVLLIVVGSLVPRGLKRSANNSR
jgi:choice-of-anchor C domain-containing protein